MIPGASGAFTVGILRQRFRTGCLSAVMVLLLGSIWFYEWVICDWSRFDCREEEIDLSSGRARVTWYLLYHQRQQEVRETPVSRSLGE